MELQQYNFTSDFQDLVVACILKHPKKFLAYGNIIEARYFQGVQATTAVRTAMKYFRQNGKFPTWRTLEELVADECKKNDVSPKDAQEYIVKLSKINTGDVDYVVTKTIDFVKERAVLATIKKVVEDIQEGKPKNGEIVKMFEEALKIGQNLDDMGYLMTKDSDAVIDKITSKTYGIKTGFDLLDRVWRHGWGPGWLIVPLAPPKRFKTTFAINLAMNWASVSAAQPTNVFYYPVEISQELAMMRALLNLCGCNEDFMYENPEKFKQLVKRQMDSQIQGQILWKAFPAGVATIQDIRNHAKTAQSTLGINPGAIVIDYAETVRPSDRFDKDHRQQADIYTEARALGAEFGCPVVMPDRCNGETVEKAVPNMRSFQGAFQKAGIVDIAIGLCATDEEVLQNIMRWFVFLNRHGKPYQHFRGKVDPDKYMMSIDEEIPYEPEGESSAKKKSKKDDMDEDDGETRKRKKPRLPKDLEDEY